VFFERGGIILIQVKNLKKVYETGEIQVEALRGVELQVQPGEFITIMGSSGSGKSTLMNILGCLDRPTAGSYKLNGSEVSGLNEDELAKVRNQLIGFVFQTFNLLPRSTAQQNVELPMVYAGIEPFERRRRALAALEQVGLSTRAEHRPNELSGGQRQRVAIARALVNNPSLLLADEPTGNLDSHSGTEIMRLLQSLHRQGLTIVLVTHDPEIVYFSQRVVRFRDGMIISDDKVEQKNSAIG
jgi:putative ABC transport system ATP-binding protein